MALIDIANPSEDVHDALSEPCGITDETTARRVVKQMRLHEGLFPVRMRIDESMWAKIVDIRDATNPPNWASEVRNVPAIDAFKDLVVKPVLDAQKMREAPVRRNWFARRVFGKRVAAGVGGAGVLGAVAVFWNAVAVFWREFIAILADLLTIFPCD